MTNQKRAKKTNNMSDSKTRNQQKRNTSNIYVIKLVEQSMKNQQIQEITNRHSNVTDQETSKYIEGKKLILQLQYSQ